MMSNTEADSMWLQKSITLPDPLPNDNGVSPGKAKSTPQRTSVDQVQAAPNEQMVHLGTGEVSAEGKARGELDLTKMTLHTISLMDNAHRPSLARHSMRGSISNVAFVTAQEYDKLRSQLSQTKRELLKVFDIQKDLEFARFELERTQEELQLALQSNKECKRELENAVDRAEKEHRARVTIESKVNDERAAHAKEVDFLKKRIDDLRQDNSKRMEELSQQQEFESQNCLQLLHDELDTAVGELESMSQKIATLQHEKASLEKQYNDTLTKLQKVQHDAEDWRIKSEKSLARYSQLEQVHQEHIKRIKEEQEEAIHAQRALTDQRVRHLTEIKSACIKELEEDLCHTKEKLHALTDEAATLRHSNARLTEEMKQIAAEHTKELRRVAEEHQLDLHDKELQMESAMQAAKAGRIAAAEENESLHRQLSKLSEELSAVSLLVNQQEKQLLEAEKVVNAMKEKEEALLEENARQAEECEAHRAAAAHANERILSLNEQKDLLEEEYSKDLRAAKERVHVLEEYLMSCRNDLSAVRKEHMKFTDGDRTVIRELRSELSATAADRDRFFEELQAKQNTEEELRQKYLNECQRCDRLNAELAAAMSRCSSLEKRLEVELRRRGAGMKFNTPNKRSQSGQCLPKLRSASSANIPSSNSQSMKRSRTEDARVFAISGFDGNDLFLSIKQLPNVAIAECKSNMPVPSNLTHLITNGQLTIKLLTALVRGCWILPVSYVVESLNHRRWLNESNFGFQHEFPPLLKKRVFATNSFVSSKHYSTAALLLAEGGAIITDSAELADIVLCTNAELPQFERGMNWEKMVEVIYPVRIE